MENDLKSNTHWHISQPNPDFWRNISIWMWDQPLFLDMTDRHHHRTGNRFRSQLSAIARWLTESFRFHQSTYTQYVCVCVTAFIALYCWNGRSDYAIFGERTHTHFLLPNFYASESHWNWFHSFVFNVKKNIWLVNFPYHQNVSFISFCTR